MRIYGADVTPSIQSNIDPDLMYGSGGCEFCYVQCTRFSTQAEAGYHEYTQRLFRAGISPGAYHFCWQGGDPIQQAKHFFEHSQGVGTGPGELPPMIDWEYCKNLPEKVCLDFLVAMAAEVKRLWYPPGSDREHRMPVIYTYPDFARQHPLLASTAELEKYPLCLAYYGLGKEWTPDEDEEPKLVPKPWQKASLWQYAGNAGRLAGVQGACDRQVWLGSHVEWLSFIGADTDVEEPGPGAIIRDMNSYFPERN